MVKSLTRNGKEDGRGKHPNSLKNLEKNKFKPGQSGNPGGAPKGWRPISNIVRDFLCKNLEEIEPKNEAEKLAIAIIALSKGGNKTALKEVLDRLDGPIKQVHEVSATVTISMGQAAREALAELDNEAKTT